MRVKPLIARTLAFSPRGIAGWLYLNGLVMKRSRPVPHRSVRDVCALVFHDESIGFQICAYLYLIV